MAKNVHHAENKSSPAPMAADADDTPAPSYPISSVGNALRLLLLFREQRTVRLTEACTYLGVAHSTTHRLLAMLIQYGFVRQESSRAYCPGPMLVEIGLAVVQKMDIRSQARPLLEALAKEFGETVHLTVLEGNMVRYVDAIESGRALRVAARTGHLLPAHCTSAGKALLAEFSRDKVHALYPDGEIPVQTPRSISTPAELDAALDEVRRQGYATNLEESEEGVGSVAIALVNGSGKPVAAIAVAIPVSRIKPEVRAAIVTALRDTRERFRDQSR
jgi:DNA-binding IclR family transcriptional regulator